MNRLYSFIVAGLLVFSINTMALNAAVVTNIDGVTAEINNISYKNEALEALSKDGNNVSLNRGEIKSISFSAKKEEKKLDNSEADSADLKVFMEKAMKIMEKYPDVRAAVVYSESSHALRKDGSNIFRHRGVIYIAKEEALGNAHQSISFDPNRESVKVNFARSYSKDGVVTNLKDSEIKIEKGTSGSVHFNMYKNVSFSIPEVTIGSLVDYSYEIETFNPFDKELFTGKRYFKWAAPVGEAVLRVSIPTDKKLYYVSKNCPEDFSPTEVDVIDSKLYTWRMTDLEPVVSEPYMPPMREIVPRVFYSLHKNYEFMDNKLKPMYEKRFELTDMVKQKVDELTKDCRNISEKIAKLYLFCQKEIRYISIKSNLASNQVGHPAEETLKNRYGDCTDKGMLLSVMLKHIGVQAYPVVLLTNSAGRSVRDIGIFDDNHCITEVHLDGRIFYLDSTASDYRYPYFRSDDHDTSARNSMLGTIRSVPLPPPEDNAVSSKRNIIIHEDGTIDVDNEVTENGSAEASMRGYVRSVKPEEYEKDVRSSIAAYTADYKLDIATFSDPLDFDNQFKSKTVYTLNRYAPKSGKYMIFAIPAFERSFPEVSLKERKYDIVYRTSSLRTERIKIQLPKKYNVKYLPSALRVQSPYIEFEVIYDQQGDSIEITRKMAFLKRIVPVEDYKKYKEDLEKIAFSTKRKIVLERFSEEKLKEKEEENGGEK